VAALLPRLVASDCGRQAGRLLTAGMRAQADLAEQARARDSKVDLEVALAGGAHLIAALATFRRDPFAAHPQVATADAELATWQAEHARLRGEKEADAWEAAAAAWQTHGRPHRSAYALWRQAEALLAERQPSEATEVLRRAATLAEEMVPLQQEITALARRARIDLDSETSPHAEAESTPYGLTERERDVLTLLTRGHTNAQIGAALFMSPKTASVHVSHILRKLGVTGRVQAATLAERGGMLDNSRAESD
jgi:DNA-binding CsgD family transcriptional regulator